MLTTDQSEDRMNRHFYDAPVDMTKVDKVIVTTVVGDFAACCFTDSLLCE